MNHLRYALRTLGRNPAFTVPALLALALGTGATTAIFSVVYAVLLRPLPYPEADRLISVSTILAGDRVEMLVSTEYWRWSRDNRVLESLAAFNAGGGSASLIGADGPARITVSKVTVNLLATLRVTTALGRDFLPEEGRPGSANVAILSHGLWQSRFAGDPGAVGKSVNIDGILYQVIGILPETFLYLPNRSVVDALLPQKMDPAAYFDRDLMRAWDSIGRLARGVTIEQARADFTTLFAAARRDNPRLYGNAAELRLVPYAERITGGVQLVLTLLLAAAGCVLLIACANVANLLLARGAARRKELAVRVALGASRARLVRELLSENLVLAFAGGAAGCGIAFGAVQWLRASAGQRLPRLGELTVDARVLWFALLLSLGTSVLFGLLPAVSVTRADVSGWLKRAGRTRLQSTLVAGELALSVVLLVSAGLLLQSLWRLQHKRLGFDPENLVVTEVSLRGSQFEKTPRQSFYRELRDRMARIPGTLAMAFTDGLPPGGGYSFVTMARTGQPRTQVRSRGDMVTVRHVSPSYFETLLIPLQRGRLFADGDRDAGMINEALSRRFFPGEDPIGKTFGNRPPITIVGIVADVKNDGLASSPIPELLLPFDGANPDSRITVVVRTIGDWPRAAAALRQELRQMDPRILASVHTMREQFQSLTSQPRFNSGLFGGFAAIALLLAAVGIYGVVAFAVASRTHEIGIRMALGADGPRVVRFVLRDAAVPAMAGIVAGICGAAAVGRYLASLLYDIKPADPVTYAAVAVLLLMVVLAASLIPARRACRVDPLSVLRAE